MTITASTPTPSRPSALELLSELGQSVWIDWLSRDLLFSGRLQRLITDHAVTGVTTDPTMLERAIAAGRYNRQIADLYAFGFSPNEIAGELVRTDVSEAARLLLPVWRNTGAVDGYVSWEVDPALAQSPAATLGAIRQLYELIELPNLLVKIPATEPGLQALEDAIAAGYSVNATLIFSLERYAAVVESYLRGLRRAADAGRDLASIHSVASFFISRLDMAADTLLERKRSPFARSLQGRLGIASAKLAYRHFQACFSGTRWEALCAQGASPQRLLWATSSTNTPVHDDVLYVEELIGPQTVTTLPEATLHAFQDHGRVGETLTYEVERAALTFGDLAIAGLDVERLTVELERDGIEQFARSLEALETRISAAQPQAA